MNSYWDVIPHKRNQELSSPEVNGATIILSVKQGSHCHQVFEMGSRYLVCMVDTFRLCSLLMGDINIQEPSELY